MNTITNAVAQLYVVHQLHPFLDQGALFTIIHPLVTYSWTTVIQTTWGYLEELVEASIDTEGNNVVVTCASKTICVISLLH